MFWLLFTAALIAAFALGRASRGERRALPLRDEDVSLEHADAMAAARAEAGRRDQARDHPMDS